ncbi:hypothetical protein NEHOM01_1209 [Nematocida homosporus]|uniref:uncharacterized protein n=1 Tax=Nematocida homosporus TaxID=1912981 RepID=UPI0022206D5E|nr:uncharacterized protein NEHOM01_1209 [Nematocida homosporus]KAI5185986.1 hypothetical protein NEHOM01_1209 [Nematocida homosporus]
MPPRTPRRTAVRRTPYRPRESKLPKPESPPDLPETKTQIIDLVKYYKEKDRVRDEYIKALKEENAYLRSHAQFKSSQDTTQSSDKSGSDSNVIDCSALLGLTVTKVDDVFHCTHTIEKGDIVSSIGFTLTYANGIYTYTHKESNIRDLPDYLTQEIYFEEDQIKLFFFNIYECVARRE